MKPRSVNCFSLKLDFGPGPFTIRAMRYKTSRRRFRIVWIILAVIAAAVLLSRCRRIEEDYPRDELPRLHEVWSSGSGTVKAVRIPLEGIILRAEDESLLTARPDMVENVLTQIRAASNDPDMRAVILEVNSPGGGVTPSDEIYHALAGFRGSRPDRRVVVFIRDLGASGAYYAAMAGDWIIAEPTSAVGSIGVIMQTINLQGLSEKLGVTDVTIKSGENKDLLNPFRPVDARQTALLQELIDDMQRRFTRIVSQARGLDPAVHPELFDGRILSAAAALDKGLIDEVGYWNDALARTAQLLDTGALRVIRYETEKSFIEYLIGAWSPVPLPDFRQMGAPRFLYQWKP